VTAGSALSSLFLSRFLNTPLVHPNHGTAYSWADHARDLTSFILHYLPVNPSFSSNLPSELERRDAPSQRDGIVTVGHSFSGNAFLLAELEKGRDGGKALAEGVILFDPMVRLFLVLSTSRAVANSR